VYGLRRLEVIDGTTATGGGESQWKEEVTEPRFVVPVPWSLARELQRHQAEGYRCGLSKLLVGGGVVDVNKSGRNNVVVLNTTTVQMPKVKYYFLGKCK
jgi:hypothetical protein